MPKFVVLTLNALLFGALCAPAARAADDFLERQMRTEVSDIYARNPFEDTWQLVGTQTVTLRREKDYIENETKLVHLDPTSKAVTAGVLNLARFDNTAPYAMQKSVDQELDAQGRVLFSSVVQRDERGYHWTDSASPEPKRYDDDFKPNIESYIKLSRWVTTGPKLGDELRYPFADLAPIVTARGKQMPKLSPFAMNAGIAYITTDPLDEKKKIYIVSTSGVILKRPDPEQRQYQIFTQYIDEAGDVRATLFPSKRQMLMILPRRAGEPPFLKINVAPPKFTYSSDVQVKTPMKVSAAGYVVTVTGAGHETSVAGPHQSVVTEGDTTRITISKAVTAPPDFNRVRPEETRNAEDEQIAPDWMAVISFNVKDLKEPEAKVVAIARSLTQNLMQYCSSQMDDEPALLVTQTLGIGDCTEFAKLTAIAARKLGLPARVVTGYFIDKDLAIGHNWNEVFIAGEWKSFDPLAGRFLDGSEAYLKVFDSPAGDNATWTRGKHLRYVFSNAKE